jgi:ribokinase
MAVIAVAGNVNADVSYDVDRLPHPGETLPASALRVGPGGKAANASVALAHLGADAQTISCIGDDALGAIALEALQAAGVDTRWVARRTGLSTGTATVLVAPPGEENAIITFLGANLAMRADEVPDLSGCAALLLTLGLPEPVLLACVAAARAAGALIVVDTTPLRVPALPADLTAVDVLSANRVEAEQLTGASDPEQQVAGLHALGARAVALKLGPAGALCSDGTRLTAVEAPPVQAVDPTGAGDAFMAGLTLRLVAGDDLETATAFACRVGAHATTAKGAQGAWAAGAGGPAPVPPVG